MSEFKVGDWIVRTDKRTESIYQITSIQEGLIKCTFKKNGEDWRLHTTKGEIEHATPEEIALGHRIDKPSDSRELETLDKPENHISPNCKVGMFEMDKCREEFEKQRYWIGLFRTGVDFDVTLGEFGRYISNGTKSTDAMDLESFNEKWEAWANCWQHQQAKVEELKASHHGEVIGHEVHFKKIKQERDELQTLYTQQGINMLKLQKRVQFLEQELGAWKGKSIAAMINGMCKQCGKEPWQAIVSDKEGYALLHCFGCGANKYELVGEQALKGEQQ